MKVFFGESGLKSRLVFVFAVKRVFFRNELRFLCPKIPIRFLFVRNSVFWYNIFVMYN